MSDLAAQIGASIMLLIGALLLIGAAHKVQTLRRGLARFEPMLRLTPWDRVSANPLLALIAGLEVAIAAALIVAPAAGAGAGCLLLAFYATQIRRLPAEQSCQCFGGLFVQEQRGAFRRNLVLLALSLLVMIGIVAGIEPRLSNLAIGLTATIAAGFLGAEMQRRVAQRTPRRLPTERGVAT